MIIDPHSHLLLHRQRQHDRDRRLGHLAAIRATGDTADVIASTNSAITVPWQRLLRSGRRRAARGSQTC
jgi:hypothetical protein